MRQSLCSWHACAVILASIFPLNSCRSTQSSSAVLSEVGTGAGLPSETARLWEDYKSKAEAGGVRYQEGCKPQEVMAKGPSKGLVIIYHGFTGCPNQFRNVADELGEQGFDVLLPTLPGNGRRAKNQDALDETYKTPDDRRKIADDVRNNRESDIVKDDDSGIPYKTEDYYRYAEEMTKIAKSYPGQRILIGLSLGGGLATATLIKGADLKSPGETNVWSRGLLITPFFQAPGGQGTLARIVGTAFPRFQFGFGNNCESGQLEVGYRFRNGICDFDIGQIQTLQNLGDEIGKKKQMSKIQIPVQIIGVANDNTSDNTAFLDAFKFTSPSLTRICFYPDEVNHATIIAGDFVPFKTTDPPINFQSARERNAVPRFARFWARQVQDRIIDFVANGFSPDGGPFKISAEPSTETNESAKRCELNVDFADILQKNRELCASDPRVDSDYCDDLEQSVRQTCENPLVERLTTASALKFFCQSLKF